MVAGTQINVFLYNLPDVLQQQIQPSCFFLNCSQQGCWVSLKLKSTTEDFCSSNTFSTSYIKQYDFPLKERLKISTQN